MAKALDFLERAIRAAASGGGLTPADTALLGRAIKAAAAGGSIDAGLGLSRHWRSTWRARGARDIVAQLYLSDESRRACAARLRRELTAYRTAGYQQDRRSQSAPRGQRRLHYALLSLIGGRVPSEETLRVWLSGARGQLREHVAIDAKGRRVSTFSGKHTFIHAMAPPAQRVKFNISS